MGRPTRVGRDGQQPDDVRVLTDGTVLRLAGLELTVDHAPGHTPGSVALRSGQDVMFSGDLLFAGSIGRSDTIGGDPVAMQASLSWALTLPDHTVVLPGHGGSTTIGHERATNPHLRGLVGGVGGSGGPSLPRGAGAIGTARP